MQHLQQEDLIILHQVEREGREKKGWLHHLHIYMLEIYLLSIIYFRRMYQNTMIVETLLLFYIGFGLLLAFSNFRLENTFEAAFARVGALILIRLAITINTMPVFITVFQRARKEEIAGLGKDGLAFEPVSVYFAKFWALNVFRVLFFIPFTAIVYPIIGFRGGAGHVLIFFLTLAVQQMAAISIGLLISSIFTDLNKASVVISTIVLITFIFSGSIVPRFAVPAGLHWLEFLSIGFYAHQALTKNELVGVQFTDRGTGDLFLVEQEIEILGIWPSLACLVLYTIICNIFGPIALCWSTRRLAKK